MQRLSFLLMVAACSLFACSSSDSGDDTSEKLDSSADVTTDVDNKDSGKPDVDTACPSSPQPQGACTTEGQSCSNNGCSNHQPSELYCHCSNHQWMCAALSCVYDAGPEADAKDSEVDSGDGDNGKADAAEDTGSDH